jgi:hypothetical protein
MGIPGIGHVIRHHCDIAPQRGGTRPGPAATERVEPTHQLVVVEQFCSARVLSDAAPEVCPRMRRFLVGCLRSECP